MAQIETWVSQDLQRPVKVKYLDGNIFSADNDGNLVGVEVTNNGSPATLSGSISGSIIRSDGATVAATGSFSGNRASIVLPQDAYLVPGVVSIIIKDTNGSQVTTLAVVVANVYQSSTDTVVDPGTILPSIATLIAAIDEAVASIPADYSSLWSSLAPEFSSSKPGGYEPGEYCTYNGALYVCITPHTGSWDSTKFSTANLGNGLFDIKCLLYNNKHSTNSFIQGRRNGDGTLGNNSNRCCSAETFYLYPGDVIRVSNIASGHKVAIGCSSNGSLAYDSGWFTGNFMTTVKAEGFYYALEALADGVSDLTPSSVTTLIEVTHSTDRLNVVDNKYAELCKSIFTPVSNNAAIFNGAGYVTQKGIDIHTGIEKDIGSTGNNYAYLDYVPIVKGATIHFPQVYPFTMNAFFYDKEKNFLGCAIPNSEFGDLWNVTFQDDDACFVRFGCYNSTGHSDSYDEQVFCFAYSETSSNEAEENMNFTSGYCADDGTISNYPSAVISTLQYTENPLEFHSKNQNLNIFAAIYDLSGTFEYTTGEFFYAPVPSNKYYRLIIRTVNRAPLSIKHIGNVYKRTVFDNIGNVYVNSTGIIQGSNTYIGLVDIAKAESDLLVHCDDWTNYQYTLAFIENGAVFAYYTYRNTDIIIPKGSSYLFSVKNVENVPASKELFNHVKLIEIDSAMRSFSDIQMNGLNDRLSLVKERVAALEGLSVPSYYESHISSKASTIETLYDGLNGDQFIFFTDPHFGGYNNTNHSKSLFNYLINHTHINKVFNGGDIIKTWDYQETMDYGNCAELLREALKNSVPDASAFYYFILGNHDTGLDYDGQGNTNGPYVTTQELYDIIGQGYNYPQLVVDPASYGFQYFFDNPGRKMRYIISNILLRDVGGTEGYVASMNFVAQALMSTPSGYSIVVFNHIIVDETGNVASFLTSDYFPMLDKYNNRQTYTYGGNTYNFAQGGGEVVCIIGGHTHYDYNTTTTGGIPVIVTTTDNAGAEYAGSGLTRTPGTISEQAFDVFTIDVGSRKVYATRIGAGQNREFNMR